MREGTVDGGKKPAIRRRKSRPVGDCLIVSNDDGSIFRWNCPTGGQARPPVSSAGICLDLFVGWPEADLRRHALGTTPVQAIAFAVHSQDIDVVG